MVDLEDLLKRAGDARGPDGLARIWRRAKPGFTRPLRMKDMGALGQMIRACEGDAPRAARALAHAAVRWEEFRAQAAALDGLKKTPGAPHVGFLLAHFEVAVAMAEQPAPELPKPDPERDSPVAEPVDELTGEAREEYLRFLEDH